MERVGCGQPVPVLRKAKKKQAKDELDRQKQAEKKKRRLEKALAISAAIRSELEKKKQKKIEEQQRLDEEGAAVAEAVALHVLLGEDTDESCQFMLSNGKGYSPWDYCSGYQNCAEYSVEGLVCVPDAYWPEFKWNDWKSTSSSPHGLFARDLQMPYLEGAYSGAEICPGQIAAQAFSSLQLAEAAREDPFLGELHLLSPMECERKLQGWE